MSTQITLKLPDQIFERAKQLAQQRQQDIPLVIEEILDDALPPLEEEISLLPEPDEALDREMDAYIAMHPMLKKRYFGKYVAIYGGQLIDHDEDFGALYERIHQRYPHEFIWLSQVKGEPIETIYVRSPRFVRDEIS